MKKQLKYLLILTIISTAMLIGAGTAFASEVVHQGTCGDTTNWTLDDEGTLTISGTGIVSQSGSNSVRLLYPWTSYSDDII